MSLPDAPGQRYERNEDGSLTVVFPKELIDLYLDDFRRKYAKAQAEGRGERFLMEDSHAENSWAAAVEAPGSVEELLVRGLYWAEDEAIENENDEKEENR